MSVNVLDSWLTEAGSVLNCKMGRVPFVYLGIPIGGDSRKLNLWCLGDRLVLLKYILSSHLVYFLSFFRAPAGIISFIESIFGFFLSRGD